MSFEIGPNPIAYGLLATVATGLFSFLALMNFTGTVESLKSIDHVRVLGNTMKDYNWSLWLTFLFSLGLNVTAVVAFVVWWTTKTTQWIPYTDTTFLGNYRDKYVLGMVVAAFCANMFGLALKFFAYTLDWKSENIFNNSNFYGPRTEAEKDKAYDQFPPSDSDKDRRRNAPKGLYERYENVMYWGNFITLSFFVLWGPILQYCYEFGPDESASRNMLIASASIICFSIYLNEGLKYLHLKNYKDLKRMIMGELSLKLENVTPISPEKLESLVGKKATLPITGNAVLSQDHLSTNLLAHATNLAASKGLSKGITPSNFCVRKTDDGTIIASNDVVAILDRNHPHSETFDHPDTGYILKTSTEENGTVSIRSFLRAQPLVGVLGKSDETYKVIPLNDQIFGFARGYCNWMDFSDWISVVFCVHMLATYLLITRNTLTAVLAFCITILPPFYLKLASYNGYWFEYLTHHILFGWTLIVSLTLFMHEDLTYILSRTTWNDTSTVWQGNSDYDSLDDSTTALTFTALDITISILVLVILFINLIATWLKNPTAKVTQMPASKITRSTRAEASSLLTPTSQKNSSISNTIGGSTSIRRRD